VRAAVADVFSRGGAGAEDLVSEVLGCLDGDGGAAGALPALYPLEAPVREKIHTIATRIYGANGVTLSEEAEWRLAVMEAGGLTAVPVCMAKTQNSLSDDPSKPGRPTGFTITVRDFEPASGAGFLVALTGDIMRMPALPRVPAAERIDVSGEGVITGPSFS
jgi:formate--tetrahydrofolate ligase